jgi:hypothetical protein
MAPQASFGLKVYLGVWNELVFVNVEYQRKNLLDELCILDGLEEERALNVEEKLKEVLVIRRYLSKKEVTSNLERALVKRGGPNA